MYVQDDWRATQQADAEPGPALGRVSAVDRGRRPPVELRRDERRISCSLPTTRTIGGRAKSAGGCRPTRRATSARASGFAYDVWRRRQDDRSRRVRRVLELHARAARPRRRRRTSRSSQSLALTPTPVSSTGVNAARARTACRRRPACDPNRPPQGNTRSIFDRELPRRLRAELQRERPARASAPTTWSRPRMPARGAGTW